MIILTILTCSLTRFSWRLIGRWTLACESQKIRFDHKCNKRSFVTGAYICAVFNRGTKLSRRGYWVEMEEGCKSNGREQVGRVYFLGLGVEAVNPFTPKSDQVQISPAPSPVILHHTAWRTWLFIAYSDEKRLYNEILIASLIHFSLKGWENVPFERGRVKAATQVIPSGQEADPPYPVWGTRPAADWEGRSTRQRYYSGPWRGMRSWAQYQTCWRSSQKVSVQRQRPRCTYTWPLWSRCWRTQKPPGTLLHQ